RLRHAPGPEGKPMTAIDILPPEPRASRARSVHPAAGNVVDASFVTLRRTIRRSGAGAGAEIGRVGRRSGQPSSPVTRASWTSIAEGVLANSERALMRLSADFFAAVVAVLFVIVFGLSGGFSLLLGNAGASPRTPALDLTHVNLTSQDVDGMRVLLITGIVENKSPGRLGLPAIHADLVTDGSIVASTAIEPPVSRIESGHSHGFSARIPHPGGKMPELKLSFASSDASRP